MSSFCVLVIFSETIWAIAMKLGSCIHLEEQSSKYHQYCVLTYFAPFIDFAISVVFAVRSVLSETVRPRTMKL